MSFSEIAPELNITTFFEKDDTSGVKVSGASE
jgi:hypothetical protein